MTNSLFDDDSQSAPFILFEVVKLQVDAFEAVVSLAGAVPVVVVVCSDRWWQVRKFQRVRIKTLAEAELRNREIWVAATAFAIRQKTAATSRFLS